MEGRAWIEHAVAANRFASWRKHGDRNDVENFIDIGDCIRLHAGIQEIRFFRFFLVSRPRRSVVSFVRSESSVQERGMTQLDRAIAVLAFARNLAIFRVLTVNSGETIEAPFCFHYKDKPFLLR